MVRFPRRGVHDEKPTPSRLLAILGRKGYVDVCVDPRVFDALREEWRCVKCYCNPPWSRKDAFVYRAVRMARGRIVALLLPLDPTTRWFRVLLAANPIIIVPMWRMGYARYPWMLAVLDGGETVRIVFARTWSELEKAIP